MSAAARDDFSAQTKRHLSARVGHRCSNPTCRKATSRPDPVNNDRSISTGVAAHISAAAPGGPRWDASLSPEERTDASNGVWLCQSCSRVIDVAPDAFTKQGLLAWKQHAEAAAARDASANVDEIANLLSELDVTHAKLVDFGEKWQAGEPPHDFDNFVESVNASSSYSNRRLAAYQREIAPGVTSVITRAEIVLGAADPRVLASKQEAMSGPTNYIGMRMLADEFQRLKVGLSLR